jgi:hypothetical protein
MGKTTDKPLTNAQRKELRKLLNASKPGPKPQHGPREPGGRLDRNRADYGTQELRARKIITTGSECQELTPLGILAGRGLITEGMSRSASTFRALRFLAVSNGPQDTTGVLSRLSGSSSPSVTNEQDEARALRATKRYNSIRSSMTLAQWQTVRSLVMAEQWSRCDKQLAQAIKQQDLCRTKDGALTASRDKMILPEVRRRLDEIRNILLKLDSPTDRNWTEISDSQRNAITQFEPVEKKPKLDENDIALLTKMGYTSELIGLRSATVTISNQHR